MDNVIDLVSDDTDDYEDERSVSERKRSPISDEIDNYDFADDLFKRYGNTYDDTDEEDSQNYVKINKKRKNQKYIIDDTKIKDSNKKRKQLTFSDSEDSIISVKQQPIQLSEEDKYNLFINNIRLKTIITDQQKQEKLDKLLDKNWTLTSMRDRQHNPQFLEHVYYNDFVEEFEDPDNKQFFDDFFIEEINIEGESHANSVYFNFDENKIEWFEPHGHEKNKATGIFDYKPAAMLKSIILDWFRKKCNDNTIQYQYHDSVKQLNDRCCEVWCKWFMWEKSGYDIQKLRSTNVKQDAIKYMRDNNIQDTELNLLKTIDMLFKKEPKTFEEIENMHDIKHDSFRLPPFHERTKNDEKLYNKEIAENKTFIEKFRYDMINYAQAFHFKENQNNIAIQNLSKKYPHLDPDLFFIIEDNKQELLNGKDMSVTDVPKFSEIMIDTLNLYNDNLNFNVDTFWHLDSTYTPKYNLLKLDNEFDRQRQFNLHTNFSITVTLSTPSLQKKAAIESKNLMKYRDELKTKYYDKKERIERFKNGNPKIIKYLGEKESKYWEKQDEQELDNLQQTFFPDHLFNVRDIIKNKQSLQQRTDKHKFNV